MGRTILDRWEKDFRAAALADRLAIFRDHLQRLDLPDSPDLMLEGTVRLVRMCSCYATLDGRNDQFRKFLAMQTYDPTNATEARYAYTFDICGKAFGRVLVRTKERTLDLADLYGSPWNDYQVVGFYQLWVSRPDWEPLSGEEATEIETAITNDLRFDYSEDELDFWCDDSLDESYVYVRLQDVYDFDDDDDGDDDGDA